MNEMRFQRKYGFAWIFSQKVKGELGCDPSYKEPYGGFRLAHSIPVVSEETMGSCFFYPKPRPIVKMQLPNSTTTPSNGIRLARPCPGRGDE